MPQLTGRPGRNQYAPTLKEQEHPHSCPSPHRVKGLFIPANPFPTADARPAPTESTASQRTAKFRRDISHPGLSQDCRPNVRRTGMPLISFSIHPGAILSALIFLALGGWIFWRWSRKSTDPPGILLIKIIVSLVLISCAVWSIRFLHPLVGVPLGAVCGIIIGILWGRNIGTAIANPLASLYDGGDEAPELRPFYAIALAHRKQARYDEAITEINRQIEMFPGDVEGLLLLAEIRARNLGDWTGAAEAIEEIVGNEDLPVATRAKALQALADWHLDFARNAEAARTCLQRIIDLFPGTPEATEAAQRLAHVGADSWRETRRDPRAIRIVPGDPRLGLRTNDSPPTEEVVAGPDPEVEIAALQRQLSSHPLDWEARERLATIYADQMGRVDWALAELEKLLAEPNHPPKFHAQWLHRIADLNVRCADDEPAARAALRRIIDAMPNTALAAKAQSRLDHLRLEFRAKRDVTRLSNPGG